MMAEPAPHNADIARLGAHHQYLVHTTGAAEPDLATVCDAVYDAIAERVGFAQLDAFSDVQDQMPPEIRTVEAWFRELSARQTEQGTGMAIKIRPTHSPGWDFLRAYTPWSIRVEVFDTTATSLATFHDCGATIIVSLSEAAARDLGAILPPGHEIDLLIRR